MELCFLGGAGTVTGSKYLVRAGDDRVLVDCGLFQGFKQLRLRNWSKLPITPASLASVVLTHAHIDHSGYLPLLVKLGFRGRIYCSAATYDLCRILLPDSGHLQEEEAAYANRKGFSRHQPAMPLYTQQDAEACLEHFSPVDVDHDFPVGKVLRAHLRPAGHILGACTVTLTDGLRTVAFSGDLGRLHDPIMRPPVPIAAADYLVVESTYGDRSHEAGDPMAKLGDVIRRTVARRGIVLIPSFAVGRAQSLLYAIHRLKASGAVPARLPVYLNSPMAVDATALYRKHHKDHSLTATECAEMCQAAHIVTGVEESKALNLRSGPMVIIAASGMATGGRVVHHLKAFAPDPRNTILFSGFQAGGTRGARIVAGAPAVKIHGEYIPVRAEVSLLDAFSAHADCAEILDWLRHFKSAPRHTFITHGEPAASDALRVRIEEQLGWECHVPEHLESVELV
jgi:metallo-beta-lactamase family protein